MYPLHKQQQQLRQTTNKRPNDAQARQPNKQMLKSAG